MPPDGKLGAAIGDVVIMDMATTCCTRDSSTCRGNVLDGDLLYGGFHDGGISGRFGLSLPPIPVDPPHW